MPKTKETKAQLKARIRALEAQLAHAPHFVSVQLDRVSQERMKGSAVIVSITDLSGKEPFPTFAIKDGLSAATIEALQSDLTRTHESAIEFKPKGL